MDQDEIDETTNAATLASAASALLAASTLRGVSSMTSSVPAPRSFFPCSSSSSLFPLSPSSMEHDDYAMGLSGICGANATLLSLPIEIHSKILFLLDPSDVLSYSRTCKTCFEYAESQQLWRHQWYKLSRKTPFLFLPVHTLVELGTNFKDSCRRLWQILVTEGAYGGLIPGKCTECKEYTCGAACIEDRTSKVSLDIGSKITWLITSNFTLQRHLSMVAVPKVLRCYDCDTTLDRNEMQCDCMPIPQDGNPSLMPASSSLMREAYCNNRLMSGHTALEYCSQPLADLRPQMPPTSTGRPFCLFCDDDKVNRMQCERDMVYGTRQMLGSRPYMSPEDCFETVGDAMAAASSSCIASPETLTNGYCKDTASILGANNLDLLSPLTALEHEEAFPVVKAFLAHLLKQYKMISDLQRPNCSLIFTYAKMPLAVKEALLKYLFEEMKISKICLLPKALAISQLFEKRTCIVVDSGAMNTYVWVVLDGKVDEERTQSASVGGWDVSEYLKKALTWKGNQDAMGATVSSLDTSTVKEKCRLSLNLARESDPRHQSRTETLHIKSQKDTAHQSRLELTEVTLSSELYLAPEMMYASLELPAMVQEATRDLPDYLIKDCFSHILITGGNTDLQGFSHRFSSDLRELMPEHSPIINVCPFPTGNHSWNTVMGANAVKVPAPYDDLLNLREPGTAVWMSREEYILFGCTQLVEVDAGFREG